MRVSTLLIVETIGELAGLPMGTRIATNHNKLLIHGEFAGSHYWYEEGELVNYSALVDWLPAIVLPPVMDYKEDS
jgi:hypothetical protein